MQTILVAGVLNQPFGSWPSASQSSDGISWTQITTPFAVNDYCTSLATNSQLTAISNQRGYLAVTSDMVNFTQVAINDGFGTTSIAQGNGAWCAVGSYNYINGFGPYLPGTEVAQIYKSIYGSSQWQMVWSHPNNNSEFYQIVYFPNAPINEIENKDVFVAVGNNGYNAGDIWYSLDYGTSWIQAAIPTGVGIIYSVGLYQLDGRYVWYWGCNSRVFISTTLHSPTWSEPIELTTGDIAVGISVDGEGAIVINGVNRLYISLDGVVFSSFDQLGYVFNSVVVFPYNNRYRWIAFARSTLTQYTMWYTDDLRTWTPWNNNIEVQGATINS
jgi:hypothetical protein